MIPVCEQLSFRYCTPLNFFPGFFFFRIIEHKNPDLAIFPPITYISSIVICYVSLHIYIRLYEFNRTFLTALVFDKCYRVFR